MTREEAIKTIKAWDFLDNDEKKVIETLITELKESESGKNKRISKEITQFLKQNNGWNREWLTWLEKQGEQGIYDDEDILQRFSFYSYKDEPNILYLSGLYVNEEFRNKGIGTKILEVADEVAKSLNCHAIRLKTKIGSNAERLYRRNGYNTLKREGNQVWLEKQGKQKETLCDKCKKAQPSHSCQDITALGRCYIEAINTSSNKVEPKFKPKFADKRVKELNKRIDSHHKNQPISYSLETI